MQPEIAGAASGLVNVSQQLGAAIGLAVLVTVFNSMAGHAQLVPGATSPAAVHALRDVFVVSGIFALGGLATIVFGVGRGVRSEAPEDDLDTELAVLAAHDDDAERRLAEAALSA